MPELPEVEIARRTLVRWFEGRELVRTEATKTRTFRSGTAAPFAKLKGPLTKADRRGKYLMLQFGDEGLMAHLGMTGKFVKRSPGVDEPYSRARFVLDTGEVIHFRDPRLFGEILATKSELLGELPGVKKLGRDPLVDGLDWHQLKDAIGKTKLDLKVALMDQTRLAGLGNIHAAEALFRAGLHPGRKAKSLSDTEWKALARAIHKSLEFGLSEQDGEEIEYVEEPGVENPFLIYGRAGTPCRKCKTKVKSYTQGGRTTHFCPKCQSKKRKP
ncbi:MAG: bifunctional DNA-formamidopyrimidine glycosylase/DNA-(apurinic or apyrimidinic site) lyase [Myxococcaceae bacterium]|nr:bifunctional DNA-formamidopyrimidine glycosylase/DNA-(apurinic or apyrimidinic site) lyase [Myxococcaceae bacterium]